MINRIKMITRLLSQWFYGKPASGEKMENLGVLTIEKTIVPKSFMDSFKWDSHLFNNITVIENS